MATTLTNALLSSLPPAELDHLKTRLDPVPLPARTALFEASDVPRYVHFLTSGVSSVVTEMGEGECVEVWLTGYDGLVEGLHLLGPQAGPSRCFMQVDGTALRMSFREFKQIFEERAPVRKAVLEYVQYQALLMGQLAACNRLHGMEERLARWLIMVADRTGSLEMELTQEFLSEMLGARRSSVTLTAGALQRSGLIRYQRGRIQILDRDGLEATACECLTITQQFMRRLYK